MTDETRQSPAETVSHGRMHHPLTMALRDRRAADLRIEAALKENFPADTFIKWTAHAGRTYCGNVVRHGYGDRIQVRNCETQKARWIVASQIVGPFKQLTRSQLPEGT